VIGSKGELVMEVTGYKIKEALKLKNLELQAVQSLFDESLYKFEDEKDKMSPAEVAQKILVLENNIADLQTAQSYYNLQVPIEIDGVKGTLEKAVKIVGGAGRLSKMWRTAAKGNVRDRWNRSQVATRRADEEVAIPTISKRDALELAKDAEKFASQLRSAIALGNTTVIDIGWIDENLFS